MGATEPDVPSKSYSRGPIACPYEPEEKVCLPYAFCWLRLGHWSKGYHLPGQRGRARSGWSKKGYIIPSSAPLLHQESPTVLNILQHWSTDLSSSCPSLDTQTYSRTAPSVGCVMIWMCTLRGFFTQSWEDSWTLCSEIPVSGACWDGTWEIILRLYRKITGETNQDTLPKVQNTCGYREIRNLY